MSSSRGISRYVTAEVRAWMARRALSGRALGEALGEDGMWAHRRLSGKVAFNVEELEAVATLLGVRASQLLAAAEQEQARERAAAAATARGLPHLDSNQEPTGNAA